MPKNNDNKKEEIDKATKNEIEREVSEELNKKSEEIDKKIEALEKKTEVTQPEKKKSSFLSRFATIAGYLTSIAVLFGGGFGLSNYFTQPLKDKINNLEIKQNQARNEMLYMSKLIEYMAFKNKLANIDPTKDNIERIIFAFSKSHEDFITCVNKMRKENIAIINWYNEYITIHGNHYYFPPTIMRGMDKQIEKNTIPPSKDKSDKQSQVDISKDKNTVKSLPINSVIKDGVLIK